MPRAATTSMISSSVRSTKVTTKNASDVVHAGLLEEQETKLSARRAALVEGQNSGASTPFDLEAFNAAKQKAASPPS